MNIQGFKVNFLGDSITEGVGVSCRDHIFLNLLAAEYGFTARNYGISGSRIANQLNPGNPNDRMERCFVKRIADMEAQVLKKEKALKEKEKAKKQVLLRLAPSLWDDIAQWAEDDFRSINSQIEYLLTEAVRNHRKGR